MAILVNGNGDTGRLALEAEHKLREAELEAGGDLKTLPCPYCNRPRFARSDYIRCGICGMNWPKGYDYDKHPQVAWKQKDDAEKRERTAP